MTLHYADTSALLRVVLGQPGRWDGIGLGRTIVTSSLTEVESLRTFDRHHRSGLLSDDRVAASRGLALAILESFFVVELSASILRRAADPFPLPLGTLDAIHLSSALAYGIETGKPVCMVTHDKQLASVARACGLEVEGV